MHLKILFPRFRFVVIVLIVSLFIGCKNQTQKKPMEVKPAPAAYQAGTFGYDLNFLKKHQMPGARYREELRYALDYA